MKRVQAAFLFCVLQSALCISATAQETWTLSTADLHTESVALQSIDEKGVHVIGGTSAQPRIIASDDFLQLDRTLAAVERPSKFMLQLTTGDRVGGVPVKLENDKLTWKNTSVGELLIPLSQIAALGRSARTVDFPPGNRSEDVVTLANGDIVRGIVASMSADSIGVKTADAADAPANVQLDSIVSVTFASTGISAGVSTQKSAPSYRIRLDDGSSIVGTSLALAGAKLTISIGGVVREIGLDNVSGIEQVNGPVSWLTSIRPREDVQTPFVGIAAVDGGSMWRTRIDTDVAGQPFVVGGRSFQRGIGVHSYSRLVFPLDGSYKAFRTRYGMNDSLVRADVTVRILVGGKTVHEAKNVKAGVLSPVVVVDLPADAKELALEVDYGEGIDVEDRLNWLEPALLREKPKPQQPATKPAH